ncbi:hypothetical protein NL676_012011 [Syzygium grande]|nr:hypothetical protein NL676_012011 [Syzygium grande]
MTHRRLSPANATEYHKVIGVLQYLSMTCPDIDFADNNLVQFIHRPSTLHWVATKRLLCHLKGTLYHGLLIRKNSFIYIHVYSDADWATDKNHFTSTSAVISSPGEPANNNWWPALPLRLSIGPLPLPHMDLLVPGPSR